MIVMVQGMVRSASGDRLMLFNDAIPDDAPAASYEGYESAVRREIGRKLGRKTPYRGPIEWTVLERA